MASKKISEKVLMLAMEYEPIIGGGASYVKNLVKSLSNNKFETVLVTNGVKDEKIKINDYFSIIHLQIFTSLYRGEGNIFNAVNSVIEIISAEKPRLIHAHHTLETLIAQAANEQFNLPLIVTHHKTPEYLDEKLRSNGKWSLHDYVNKRGITKFITPSKAFSNLLLESGVDSNKIVQIYPGVDTEFFSKQKLVLINKMKKKLKIKLEDKVVLIPSMVRNRKGINYILESVSRADGQNIKVLLSGLASSMLTNDELADLEKIVKPHTLLKTPKFTGNEMPILYSLVDCTVCASQAEGLGLSALEALSSESPLIATNVIGLNEIAEDMFNSRVVEYGDREMLTQAIESTLTDKNGTSVLVKKGKETIKNKFNLDNQGKEHIRLYKNLYENRKQSAGGVCYRKDGGHIYVYLPKHDKHGYVIPKGNQELGEMLLETAIREISEETGYVVKRPKFFLDKYEYSFTLDNKDVTKTVFLYAFEVQAESEQESLKLDEGEQIRNGKWFEISDAIENVAHESEKKTLQKLLLLLNYVG